MYPIEIVTAVGLLPVLLAILIATLVPLGIRRNGKRFIERNALSAPFKRKKR